MRKNKKRETLRGKIRGSRAAAGRPLDPPRSEKQVLERARARLALGSAGAAELLVRGTKTPVDRERIACADSILDRVGIGRKQEIEHSGDLTTALVEIFTQLDEGADE